MNGASDTGTAARSARLPVGIVVRRAPGATRWAKWSWRVVALMPGAGPGGWTELRRDGEIVDYHAATVPLELHRAETDGYLVALNGTPPAVFVILRRPPGTIEARPEVVKITASAYDGQDHTDNGEDIVERVPMPEGLEAWIAEFCRTHHVEEAFVKRKRTPHHVEAREDGKGDARVRQAADVYRAPASLRAGQRGEGAE
ncbi:DUF3305 domain-containing protein [Roseivivax isoporae]|uniref:Molybdopterin-guanine dinucleotide biosynthesis protein A n=1 Tax=Roseivivax isoporae LMG 25204 TaxID=1449351 RepID=X7FE24_9RHOB|nr:DUF3305 domain-containing protein [Roseivivax isoporae]ETX30304.1 hypothetical protein RISW2_15830 [Roseivivax isoporae LMG 25204]